MLTLKEMGFPVWSRAISAKGTVKATLGAVNMPVVCAGVNVNPGDAVVADDDGVVVIARAKTSARRCRRRRRSASPTRTASAQKLASGVLGLDMYNMREPLEKAGLIYVDQPEDA